MVFAIFWKNLSRLLEAVIIGRVPIINLDPRVKPEYDNRKRMCFTPEDNRNSDVSTGIFDHLSNVILGFIPRIHAEHTPMDTRVTPEYDGNLMVDPQGKPEYDHNDLHPQCAPDTTGFLSDVYKRSTRTQKTCTLEAAVFSGRSMIEMLGVLAIIGVLSVGGIQGFSKAMHMYRWNKALREWDILINTVAKYKSQLQINNTPGEYDSLLSLIPILKAIGDLPDDMPTEKNDEYLIDALGNRLRVYSHISGYVGIGYFVEKNDVEACKMFLTMGKYNHKLIQYIQFYNIDKDDDKDKKQNKLFYGDYYGRQNCTQKNPCLRDLTISQINELCTNNTVCKDTKSCRYLVYWY